MADVRGGAGAVTGTVLVHTNVFTARLRERSALATTYAKHLFGQRIALAPQTVAEARYGALNANWGPARQQRLARLSREPAFSKWTSTRSRPSPSCATGAGRSATPLHQSNHNADLWIAATAIRRRIPLILLLAGVRAPG